MKLRFVLFLLALGLLFVYGCSTQVAEETDTLVDTSEMEEMNDAADVVEGTPEEQPEVVEETTEETEPETVEEVETTGATTHRVEITDDGFEPDEITVSVGDTVVWSNVREDRPLQALVTGNRVCRVIQSDMIYPGEEFSYTFGEVSYSDCDITEAVNTYSAMEIHIE